MPRRLAASVAMLLIAQPLPVFAQEHAEHHPAPAADSGHPPLYDNLGTLHRAVHTSSPEAQKYFDQGLRLTYAFNHAEAVEAFTYATTLDPNCAMCWWGIANALGPNINAPMEATAVAPAAAAAQKAEALAATAGPRDRALIEAQAVRFTADPPADRSPLDSAYADKLRAANKRFPNDPDIGALFGESLLDLRPWAQWKHDGTPEPGTLETVAVLERVITKYPNHPGACHFYIHTVEASHTPERALPCARRLVSLMPGAGHLVHMPAHIALRVGDYAGAIRHNEHAVHADQVYLDGPHTDGIYGVFYYAHNWHFLSTAAAFAGRSALAVDAGRRTAEAVPLEIARQAPVAEYFLPIAWFAMVRFGKWDEMLAEPAPPPELRYTTGMWRFGHGMALLGKDDPVGAQLDLDSLRAIRAATSPDLIMILHPAVKLLGIYEEILAGSLAAHDGDGDQAVEHFEQAVTLEESLNYDEPPPAYIPARELLGREFLRQGKPKEAEAAFLADLRTYRENGWALAGLAQALRAQHKTAGAASVEMRRRRAWLNADVNVSMK